MGEDPLSLEMSLLRPSLAEEVTDDDVFLSRVTRIISCSLASLASSAWMSCIEPPNKGFRNRVSACRIVCVRVARARDATTSETHNHGKNRDILRQKAVLKEMKQNPQYDCDKNRGEAWGGREKSRCLAQGSNRGLNAMFLRQRRVGLTEGKHNNVRHQESGNSFQTHAGGRKIDGNGLHAGNIKR